jgi:hypothetical protein
MRRPPSRSGAPGSSPCLRGSIRGGSYQAGPLIDLSIWLQVALSLPHLGPLSCPLCKSTSRFDHMASCRQVDMSSSPTVDISLLPDLHARFGLGAAHRMSSGVGGHSRLPDRRGTMAPAATPTHVPRAAVLGAPPSPGDPDSPVEVPGARAHVPRREPERNTISLDLSLRLHKSSVRSLRGSVGSNRASRSRGTKKGADHHAGPLSIEIVQSFNFRSRTESSPRAPKSSRTYATAALTIRPRSAERP